MKRYEPNKGNTLDLKHDEKDIKYNYSEKELKIIEKKYRANSLSFPVLSCFISKSNRGNNINDYDNKQYKINDDLNNKKIKHKIMIKKNRFLSELRIAGPPKKNKKEKDESDESEDEIKKKKSKKSKEKKKDESEKEDSEDSDEEDKKNKSKKKKNEKNKKKNKKNDSDDDENKDVESSESSDEEKTKKKIKNKMTTKRILNYRIKIVLKKQHQ